MSYLHAFSTLGCPALTLDEAIAVANRHGLDGVELRALAGTVDLPAYFARTYGTPAGLAERLRGEKIKIVSFDTSLKIATAKPADREALLAFLPWAEALGGTRLRAFDGGSPDDPGVLEAMAATIAWWRELRGKNGWRSDLMVETHDTLFTAESILRFLALAPGTGILWDTHHTWKRSGEAPAVTWRAIAAEVVHVHVKDSISQPSGRHPFTYVLPGAGEFPAAEILPRLQAEFSGCVSLEWEKMWHPYLPPVETALEAANAAAWW